MLQGLLREVAGTNASSGTLVSSNQGDFCRREEVHSMDGWFYSQLSGLVPADVDEQVGVRGAWCYHDRAQMPMKDIRVS